MMKRLLLVPYTFVLLNWAAVRGLLCYLSRDGLDRVWSDGLRPHAVAQPLLHSSEP
jgi:hypothetical protein